MYKGSLSDYNILVYIDFSDHYFRNSFSIVFKSAYSEISNEKFKELNDKYYNRIKSLLLNTEYVFFDKKFVEFRYGIGLIRMKPGLIRNKLEKIRKILIAEEMNPDDFGDIRRFLEKEN